MTYPVFSAGEVLGAADMNAVGMWKTGSFVFAGQTSAQINNCFTADFDRYKIIYNLRVGSGAQPILIRLSAGGVPNATASSYVNSGRYVGFPGVGASDFSQAGTEWNLTFTGTFSCGLDITVNDPNSPRATSYNGTATSVNASVFFGGYHNQNTSYDGIYVFNGGSVAMYGSIGIYGLRN